MFMFLYKDPVLCRNMSNIWTFQANSTFPPYMNLVKFMKWSSLYMKTLFCIKLYQNLSKIWIVQANVPFAS